jgi:hypothetical protein
MKNHSFTVSFSGLDYDTPNINIEDLFYEAGCDDALLHSIGGKMYLAFDREALSYEQAVTSAIKDIESAHPDVKVTCVEEGFLGRR